MQSVPTYVVQEIEGEDHKSTSVPKQEGERSVSPEDQRDFCTEQIQVIYKLGRYGTLDVITNLLKLLATPRPEKGRRGRR